MKTIENDAVARQQPTGISVVTAAHGRVGLIEQLLESLDKARANSTVAAEVLIVDSSPADEGQAIRAACDRWGARYIHHAANNVRQKRNLGIEQAHYPIVLFVDSDCRALPNLLDEHAQSYAADDRIGGVIGLTRFVGAESWVWKVIEKTSLLDAFSYAARQETVPWGPTCNISYRRDVLETVGTFDTSFPFRLGGDDTDLGLRVTATGYTIKGNPRAVVEHARATWSGTGLIGRRVFRWGRMHFHLMQKHPGRVYYDFPSVVGLVLLLLDVTLLAAILVQQPALLIAPLGWLAIELPIETLLIGHLLRYRLQEFAYLLGARVLSLVFECGTLLEAFRSGSLQPLYKEISYTPPSLHGRNRRIAQIWAMMLALVALLAGGWLR